MSLQSLIVFAAGLGLVIWGADLIVKSASRIAARLGVKPLLIGLTVVALGTSTPELAVGITAGLEGRGALAVGNIAGASLINILFTLGLSAAIRPLQVHLLTIRLDVPAMIGAALVLILMAWDGHLARYEGMLLLAAGIVYMTAMIRVHSRDGVGLQPEVAVQAAMPGTGPEGAVAEAVADAATAVVADAASATGGRLRLRLRDVALLVAGLFLAIKGADLLVDGAAAIALAFGVSDAVIGLTIVAMGTCMPEFATTMVGTIRGERDVAIGNLIGSCIYNILFILGIACMVSPGGFDVSRDILMVDLPLAALVALACLPVFRSGRVVSRTEGMAFVGCYLLYLGMLLFVRT